MRRSIKAALLGACLASTTVVLPGIATAGAVVDIEVAPPPVRVEAMPPPRAGYVWAPGYWEWRGHEHVWVGGRWVGERRGYRWVPDRWEQVGPRWHHYRGHWER